MFFGFDVFLQRERRQRWQKNYKGHDDGGRFALPTTNCQSFWALLGPNLGDLDVTTTGQWIIVLKVPGVPMSFILFEVLNQHSVLNIIEPNFSYGKFFLT